MSDKVWMSSLFSNYDIGNKQGLRSKFYGHDWQPATFEIPLSPDEVHEAMKRYSQGFVLQRAELPEAAAVWNENGFKKVADIFTCGGGAFVVRGKLADTLSHFDLGQGGLIPFPIYQADLETPYPGEFFLLNFGCQKNTVLPEQSQNVVKFAVDHKTGLQYWKVNSWSEDADVVLSPVALEGPDLWFEEFVFNKIFMSNRLAQAIIDIGMSDVFRLLECTIAGDAV